VLDLLKISYCQNKIARATMIKLLIAIDKAVFFREKYLNRYTSFIQEGGATMHPSFLFSHLSYRLPYQVL